MLTDVTQPDQVVALADAAESRFGATHLLFNNAGVAPIGPILETRVEDFKWVLEVDVLGEAHGMRRSVRDSWLGERGIS